MNCWEILEIAATMDTRQIKCAYARLLQRYHPEDDPAGFQLLREAFEEALVQSRFLENTVEDEALTQQSITPSLSAEVDSDPNGGQNFPLSDSTVPAMDNDNAPEQVVSQWMHQINELYADFAKRSDIALWQNLFEQQLLWSIDLKLISGFEIFAFLNHNPWVPPPVLALAAEHFSWGAFQEDLYDRFPKEEVDRIIWRANNHRWLLSFDQIPHVSGADYDGYLHQREEAFHRIIEENHEAAKNHLKQASAIVSGDPQLHRLSLVAALQANEVQEALLQSETLVRRSPDYLDGQLHMAHLYLDCGKISEALGSFQYILQLSSELPVGLIGLARCHIHLGNLQEAQSILESALEQCPDHVEAQLEIVRVCHLLFEQIEPALQNGSADQKTLIGLAKIYFKAGMFTEAQKITTNYLKTVENSEIFLLRARISVELNKKEKALQYFTLARKHAEHAGENLFQVRYHQGLFHYHQEAYERAIEDLEYVRKMCLPTINPSVLFYLADAYQTIGQDKTALELFNTLLAVDDSDPRYYLHRGFALFELGKHNAALKDFELSLEQDYYCTARLWIGKCLLEGKHYDQAREALDQAEKFGDYAAQIAYCRARCDFEQKKFASAQIQIKEAIRLGSDNALYFHLAGYVEHALDDQEKALFFFRKSVLEDTNNPNHAMLAAEYCMQTGKSHQAIEYLELFVSLEYDANALLTLIDLEFYCKHHKYALEHLDTYFEAVAESGETPVPEAYFLRGRAKYARYSHPESALPDLHKACELEGSAISYHFLSLAYFDLRDMANAHKYAREALAREPLEEIYQKLVNGIERYMKAGWLIKILLNARAIELWPPIQTGPIFTLKVFSDFSTQH
jgi:tetratricopeptide (TPR) repeat protein